MHQSILHCSVFLLHCLNGHFAAMSKFTQEWLKWWPTTDDQKTVSVLWEDNFVKSQESPTSIYFLTISRHYQEKRLGELIIKNDHQRENDLIFYQIFSNILKGNIWRSVSRISIWIVVVTGGARVAQWWEHSPPTNVAQVQIPASTPYYVGWVCCWFSPLLPEVFSSSTPVFLSPQKPALRNFNSIWNAP